jgi:hypothetical protein
MPQCLSYYLRKRISNVGVASTSIYAFISLSAGIGVEMVMAVGVWWRSGQKVSVLSLG